MNFLVNLGDQPRGLKDLGYNREDIPGLVQGTLPQRRVLMLAPNLNEETNSQIEELTGILEDSLVY